MASEPTLPASGAADRAVAAGTTLAAAAITLAFAWMLADAFFAGAEDLTWSFLVHEPFDAGRSGGIGPIIVSTVLVLGVSLTVAVPLGVACAAFLSEIAPPSGWAHRLVVASLDLLATVPSIVFGLFGMVVFGEVLGLGLSILSGGLTLACMILPIILRASYAGFRAIAEEIRLGAAALGMTAGSTLRNLLLPLALRGIVAGLLLGVGRAMAETAALLFTSGYVARMPTSLLDSGRTLSVHIYDLAMNVPGGESRAWATTLVLVAVLLLVNGAALRLSDTWTRRRLGA